MSKAREAWIFQEVVSSSKLNQANTDWITRAVPILSTVGSADATTFQGGGAKGISNTIVFPAYPYNPAKRVEDRMRVWAIVQWDESNTGTPWVIEYTLDSGTVWNNAALPDVIPANVVPITPYGATSNPGTEDFIRNQQTIDISGIAATQWLTWRIRSTAALDNFVAWSIGVWLYNSVDTPH